MGRPRLLRKHHFRSFSCFVCPILVCQGTCRRCPPSGTTATPASPKSTKGPPKSSTWLSQEASSRSTTSYRRQALRLVKIVLMCPCVCPFADNGNSGISMMCVASLVRLEPPWFYIFVGAAVHQTYTTRSCCESRLRRRIEVHTSVPSTL